jgi:adenylate cyclase
MSLGQQERVERRLAAIMAVDIVGYSRLMGADEEGTHAAFKALRRGLTDPKIEEHRGRIVKSTGDGLLVEFASVVDAVRCAVEVQAEMGRRNTDVPEARRLAFRIGINLGDIIVEDHDIYGDGVNVSARLEALAEPGGICLSRVVRDQVRDKLDLVFEDMGDQPVKNIPRPVHAYRIPIAGNAPPRAELPLPDKPSLAVLPFQNMTGDAAQDYFVDGVVEEITTAISRLPWLFVISRNSSFTYKGQTVDVKRVSRELGVRYVLEGSVRKADSRVRITGQLIDAATGVHIWADRFDGVLADVIELQDRVAGSIVGAIEPRLRHSEIGRAANKPTSNLDARDLYLRALAQFHKHTAEGMAEAVALLRRALAIDPSSALAAAMIGFCRINQIPLGSAAVSDAENEEALRLARWAIETGGDDPDALWMAGDTLSVLAGDHDGAANAIDRALIINPNSAHAWMASGWVSAYQNHPDKAIQALDRARRLSPLDPLGNMFTGGLALAHLVAGQHEQAAEWAERSLSECPRFLAVMRMQVVAYAHLDRIAEAREQLRRVLVLGSKLTTVAAFEARLATHMPPQLLASYIAGLRKAGLPEN